MSNSLGVTLNLSGLADLRKMHAITEPALFKKAVALGVKAAGKTARTQVAKGIGQKYNIKAARIKDDLGGPRYSGDTATIYASQKGPTLNQYGFKPGSRGGPQPGLGRSKGWGRPIKPGKPASAKVFRAKGAKVVRGAFLSPSGLPMQRLRQGRGRGSLRVLKGPSMAAIFGGRGVFARQLQEEAAASIDKAFVKAFEKVFSDAARGYGKP